MNFNKEIGFKLGFKSYNINDFGNFIFLYFLDIKDFTYSFRRSKQTLTKLYCGSNGLTIFSNIRKS